MDYTVHGILQARILEWLAVPFSRGSSQPRDWTQVSRIAGRFFTSWATREAQEYLSGYPIPSPVDLADPGIKPGSLALQADSLPAELFNFFFQHFRIEHSGQWMIDKLSVPFSNIIYISRCYLLPKIYFKAVYFVQSTIWENTYPTCISLIEE